MTIKALRKEDEGDIMACCELIRHVRELIAQLINQALRTCTRQRESVSLFVLKEYGIPYIGSIRLSVKSEIVRACARSHEIRLQMETGSDHSCRNVGESWDTV